MNRPTRSRRRLSFWAALAATLLLTFGVASALAAPSIEGIWSFKGGQIGVQSASGGGYEGIVVAATTFAACPHEVGEHIWTDIQERPDGSYWGQHQWFYESPPNCHAESRGPTAWRVLTEPNGSYYLRVCFSHPGTTQPEIAANGDPKEPSEYAAYHVTYSCYSSQLISLLPPAPGEPGSSSTSGSSGGGSGKAGSGGVEGFKEMLTLPSNKQCLSGRFFKIHLQDPKYDPLKSVAITLGRRKIKASRKGRYFVATIDLKGLHKGAFTIHVSATTVLGHHLTGRRTYHTCIPKLKPKKFKKRKHI